MLKQGGMHGQRRNEITRQLLVLSVSLLLSIAAGFVPDWTGSTFTTADQVLLGTVLFGVFVLLDVLWQISTVASHQRVDSELWSLRSAGEQELATIRAKFVDIVSESTGTNDLFVAHFSKEFQRLNRKVTDAAEKRELRVVSDYYLNDDSVFETFFSGDEKPLLRYTWPIATGDKLFDGHAWRRYFEVVADMTERSRIAGVRVLLILDRLQTMEDPKVRLLLDFYLLRQRQECRVIVRDTYESIARETGIPTNFLDFGIYSERMLFRSEQYEPEYVGTFTKDRLLIKNYTKFFDTLWSSTGIVKKNPSTATAPVSLEQLIETDLA